MAGYIGSKASVVSSGAERKKTFDITGTTTSLTGLSYTVNQVHVFHNGVRLVDGTDFTATNGSSITLTSAAESGDEVVVISYAGYQVSDTVSASQGGTFSGAVDVNAAGTALTLDRTGSDGTILDLKKDGSTVGSIASRAGVVASVILNPSTMGITEADTGGGPSLSPTNGSGAISDAAIDLGTSSIRWQDLYLSGGIQFDSRSNKLDDYEEGYWTASLHLPPDSLTNNDATSGLNRYTKVGNLVTVQGKLTLSGTSSSISALRLSGLPFTSGSNIAVTGSLICRNGASFSFVPYAFSSSTEVHFYQISPSGNWNQVSYNEVGAVEIHFEISYFAT